MHQHEESTKCLNCETNFKGNFCPNCGQSSHEHRINVHYFLHDIPHSVFHVDKGFFYTLRSMFTRPGRMVEDYLDGKRARYFRPFAYVLLMTTLCSIIIKGLHLWMEKIDPSIVLASDHSESFFAHYFNLFIFVMIPVSSLITWLTFIKDKYNYWEHFLANTYIAAQLNIMLVMINVINLIAIIFHMHVSLQSVIVFLILFMMAFLYLYGNVFGYLAAVDKKYKMWVIIAKLILMNFVLGYLYIYLMQVLGVFDSQPFGG